MKKQSPQEQEAVELFEYAARNLIKEFCRKQDLQFEFDNYDVGIGIICLSDYFQYRGYILRYEAQQTQRQDTAMVRLRINARV